jgi:hypothetical protein
VTASDEEKIQADRDRLEFAEVDEAVGFCKVISKISESRKIVVGHNMFLDILYTLQQFVAPLPEDYDEFKVNVLFRLLFTVVGIFQFSIRTYILNILPNKYELSIII